MNYYDLPFEIIQRIAQISPAVWWRLVQVDTRLAQINIAQIQDIFTIKVDDGFKIQYLLPNGQLHRNNDLPAYIIGNNTVKILTYSKVNQYVPIISIWYKYGVKHRDSKPAVIYGCGIVEYWVHGIEYNANVFDAKQ
jgi:hypothetical protein